MNKKLTGAILATAVASFLIAGQVKAEDKPAAPAAAKVKCSGTNACSGKGACKSADNACMGKNSCKGKGWNEMGSDKDCTDKGGKVVKE